MVNIQSCVGKAYQIEIQDIVLLQSGSDNDVYRLTATDGQKYILRISKRANKMADIDFELSVISYLYENGVSVPRVIQTVDNHNFCLIDNYPMCLFSFCTGTVFNMTRNNYPTVKMAQNGGKTLATIHRVLSGFRQQNKRQTVRSVFFEPERVLKSRDLFLQKYIGGNEFVQAVENTVQNIRLIITDETVIHNDFRVQNLLFVGDEISAVLDFDWACIGTGLKDLGHALVEWSLPDGVPDCRWDIAKAFLSGYKEINPDIDLIKLIVWMKFACLSDACTYFTDTINCEQNPRPMNSYMYQKYKYLESMPIREILSV